MKCDPKKCKECSSTELKIKDEFCSMSCFMVNRHKKNPHIGFQKGTRVRVGMKHTKEFREKRRGAGNPNWKGDNANIFGIHTWIRRNLKKPKGCETCKTVEAPVYDWSNKDHKYKRNPKDWQYLCRSCHMKYDYKNNLR